MVNVIEDPVICSTAEEFLYKISPMGEWFKGEKINAPWLFRGQGQDYPLIPSLFRKDKASKEKLQLLTKQDTDSYLGVRYAERDIITDFFGIADKRGLILPSDSQELRASLETWKSLEDHWLINPSKCWVVPDEALSLVALAQHYGIPTRLLDWTRQALIAAFFAAEDALKFNKFSTSTSLVVWAFYFPPLGRHNKIDRQDDPIWVVTAPSATNSNLKAQRGVFTQFNFCYTKEAGGNYLPMDKFLEDLANKADPEHSDADKLIIDLKLRKFTLPISEASKLLYLLAKLDITPSAVYPGYHSIISDIKMQNTWE